MVLAPWAERWVHGWIGWLKDSTGGYTAGMCAMGGSLLIAVLLMLSLKFVVKAEL